MPRLARFQATFCQKLLGVRRRDRRHSRGAALLLVLIVVPALSIVGLSLLSIASLEGGRARAQQQIAQSLYSAEGGVARATWALKSTGQLGNVGQQLPAGVSASTATQGGANTGAMNWNGANIVISATGASGPYTRQVQRQLDPMGQTLSLKNVITTPGVITLKKSCTVNGNVLTGDPNPNQDGWNGNHTVQNGYVPVLDLPTTIANILAAYTEVVVTGNTLGNSSAASPYVMSGGAGVGVYYTNDPGVWVPSSGGSGAIQVQGCVVWIIEGGADFGKDFDFMGAAGTNPRLLILATVSFSTNKQAQTSSFPLVLISNGPLDFKKACVFPQISMYGSKVDANKDQSWTYTANTMDPFIDELASKNLLPPVASPTTGTINVVSGTWAELP